jgi:dihydropteroate synthase
VLPVIERLAREVAVPISVDTYRAATAARALAAGADLVNDVTALRADADLAGVAARGGAAVVLMHSTGLPGGFHDPAVRGAPLGRVLADLEAAVRRAEAAGVAPGRIFIDPGIGFGKTQEENLALVRETPRLRALGKPVVVGPSMKSFLARALDETDLEARVPGTAAAVAIAAFLGAEVVRVHDVAAMRRVVRVAHAVRTAADG